MGYITLNKKNFFHNLTLIKEQVGHQNKIAIVLKDNAYGHGLIEMAKLANEYGILHAVVRSSKEALKISKYFKTILVLNGILSSKVPENIYAAVNDFTKLTQIKPHTKIELKIDTGMHRNGLNINELHEAFNVIIKNNLSLKGLFTHHKNAGALSSEYFWQEKEFLKAKNIALAFIKKCKMPSIRFHSQNSAATFRAKSEHDLVRVGFAPYGLLQMPKFFLNISFRPVLSLWANQVHTFKGDSSFKCGYEGKGLISKEQLLSTYDVGYADGLLHFNDDIIFKMCNGASLIGRITMDYITVNSADKHLCIFNNANDYAKEAKVSSYEVITRLSALLPKKIV